MKHSPPMPSQPAAPCQARRSAVTSLAALAALPAALLLPATASRAQGSGAAWPTKPIRLVSPFNPGGAIDVLNRVIAEKMSARLGQQVNVDAIPGANTIKGAEAVARSPGDGYTFMNDENYEQVIVTKDTIGDQAVWLQEGMKVILSIFNGNAVAIQLPPRVTLEITETEPAIKNQTASSSYKPAILSNGAKVMVPPHIQTGTRVVVQTDDGSYVERAKD